MIIDRPVLDLPPDKVAQVIIVHERDAKGKIKRSTALMRTSEIELRRMAETAQVQAMPSYWCPRGDGKLEVWPTPEQPYDADIMGVGGRPLGGSARRPVEVPTVTEFAAAINQSYEAQQRTVSAPTQIVERFSTAREDE
jgi:hypothetical protein